MKQPSTRSKLWSSALPKGVGRALPVTSLAAAIVGGSAMAQSNSVTAWGRNVETQCNVPAGLGSVQAIAGGNFHSVALRTDGTVVCWGNVAEGQATVPAGLGLAQAIAAGHFHTLALRQNGTVACWGRNVESQCNVPAGLANVTAVAGGWKHSLALKTDGLVVAWGNNSTVSQTPPASLSGVVRIAAGSQHNVALRSNGTVSCWGAGTTNTGISPNFGQAAPPAGLANVTRVAAGHNHTVALKADGTVACWGQNTNQQTSVPAGLNGVVAVAAGQSHTMALRSNGTVVAWGLNTSGQSTPPSGLGVVTMLGAGAQHSLSVVATAPSAVLVSSTPATCNGATGAIDVTVANTTSVSWSGPNGFSSSSVDLSSVVAGSYSLVANGPGGSTTLSVTVAAAPDVTAPVVTSYTANAAVDSDGNCNAVVPDLRSSVVATDNCTPAGALTVTQLPAPGTSVGLGVTSITLTVRDASNNAVTRSASFTVNGHSQVCFVDADTDTFGNPASATAFCIAPPGWVTNDDDCDDDDADIHPGADEDCDAKDDDCDNLVDEDLPTYEYFPDADADGFGDGRSPLVSCSPLPPPGFVTNSGDCNDASNLVYPGAPELCANLAVDNDCDGSIDESEAADRTTFYADADGDGSGDADVSVLACAAPEGYVGNPDDRCPANPELIERISYYRDLDVDGFGDANSRTSVCETTAPAGYVANATDCNDSQLLYADGDGDGDGAGAPAACGVATSSDCNDGNAAINPGAQEVCDEANTDEDCDALADNADGSAADAGKTDFFADLDNDGFGAGGAQRFCDQSAGFATVAGDCDDARAAINPGAQEVCDAANTDEDCDTLADDNDPSATGQSTFYRDADSDGYTGSATGAFCDLPAGYEPTNEGDCNDGNAAINPGAQEVCDAANTDEDCDTLVDDNDPSATGQFTFYRDADSDGYTGSTAAAFCDMPAGYEPTNEGDCNDKNPAINPGAQEACDAANTDEDCDSLADDADSSATGKSTFYRDADGDAYTGSSSGLFCDMPSGWEPSSEGDCNDANAAINPGAQEVCDAANTDEDCDTLADDSDPSATGKTLFYADADRDGFSGADTALFCDMPGGYEPTNEGDCNDANQAIRPGALELCNLIDDDCDTVVDEDLTYTTYYRDADADGFGLAGDTQQTCTGVAPSGYVVASGDCNDANAAINPGATEVCDPANTDEDCDTLADDGDPSATGKSTFYRDADADTYTGSTTGLFCDMPAGYEPQDDGDCNDANAAINPGATEVCDAANTDEDCDGAADNADSSASDAGKTDFYADVDGDTFGAGAAVRFCDMPSAGYSAGNTDCNDGSAAINPNAQEVCDAANTDEDCDTLADDNDPSATGKTTFYADADSDGFTGSTSAPYCDMPGGFEASDEGDCNDGDNTVYPGAVENCANLATDNDCDGSTAQSEALDAVLYYADADNDGAGDPAVTELACSAPAGYVRTAGDGCPLDAGKTAPGACGCGVPDTDTDSDGTADCNDGCPLDANKTAPGACGCGAPDTDTDSDGTADCNDGCPLDGNKTAPGTCGCGVPDVDSDGDGTLDCNDGCPLDADKTQPGVCGCGTSDIDSDENGVADCADFIVTLEPEVTSVREGNTLKVLVHSTWPTLGSPDRATGIQLVVAYDPMRLSLETDLDVRDAVRCDLAGAPFQRQIFESIDNGIGLLRYAAGVDTGALGMNADATLVEMTFDVLPGVSECDAANLIRILPSSGAAITRFSVVTAGTPGARLPRLIDMVDIDLDFDGPVFSGIPADFEIPVDADSLVGGTALEPTVSATDNCEGALPYTMLVVRPGMAPLASWPADNLFPIGASTVTWTSADSAGNVTARTLTITVGNYQHFNATLTLNGGFAGATTRPVRLTIGGVDYPAQDVGFVGRTGSISDLRVPVSAGYDCALAKDLTHALSDAAAPTVVGREYTASFALLQGDSNNDDRVDIYDFSLFVTDRGIGKATNARSNFDADTDVDNGDFGFISWTFFREGESCGSGGALAGGPVARVSVKDLRRQGLGHLAEADLNGDGWVDVRDIEQFMRGAGEPPPPGFAPADGPIE